VNSIATSTNGQAKYPPPGQAKGPSEVARALSMAELLAADLPAADALVDGVLLQGGFAVVVGEPGVGKSGLLVDLAVAAASGQPWLGRATSPTTVLIVPAEGRLISWRERLVAAARQRGLNLAELPITIYCHKVDAGRPYIRSLNLTVDRAALFSAAHQIKPGLVILDPLSDLHAGDENAVKDIRPVLADLRRLSALTGALVVLAHHARKPPVAREGGAAEAKPSQHDARGSSAIVAAADTVISLQRLDETVEVTVTKQRDLPTPRGPLAAFTIVDVDGAPAVELVDAEQARHAAGARRAAQAASDSMAAAEAAVIAALQRRSGRAVLSDVVGGANIRATEARSAVRRLIAAGRMRSLSGTRLDNRGRNHHCEWIELVTDDEEQS
jgi:hypothetical protein